MPYRWKPNSAQKDAFRSKAAELDKWLANEGAKYAAERAFTGTVYFTIEGTRYRVSSHKPGVNYNGEKCFHASPYRAPEIAQLILEGKTLDGRGKVKS